MILVEYDTKISKYSKEFISIYRNRIDTNPLKDLAKIKGVLKGESLDLELVERIKNIRKEIE